MDSQAETKNPFLTPGTKINSFKKSEMGPLETGAYFGKLFALLIPVTSGLSLAAHSSHFEVAQAAQDAWNITQGFMVVAGLQVLQSMARESDKTIHEIKLKKS